MATDEIRIAAVGDITLGDHPMATGIGFDSRCSVDGMRSPFLDVRPLLESADVRFGSLEVTLSRAGARRNRYSSVQMRGRPEYVPFLRDAGFDVLNHATNHSLQHGETCFRETVALLRETGIQVCGVSLDAPRKVTPCVVDARGHRVAFLGYSLRPRQYFEAEPIYTEGDPETMISDVKRARAEHDIVVVSVHWGDEFIQAPAPEEIRLARQLADTGADLVIGHHPHVLRGVERRGRSLIAYSLGNFVCDMSWDLRLRDTAVLHCSIGKDGVRDFRLVPVFNDDDFVPRPAKGEIERRIEDRIRELSDALARETLDGFEGKAERYRREADEACRELRGKSHRFFLDNLARFPKWIVAQQIGTYLRNRVHELASRMRSG